MLMVPGLLRQRPTPGRTEEIGMAGNSLEDPGEGGNRGGAGTKQGREREREREREKKM
jgi:hypothetical protein